MENKRFLTVAKFEFIETIRKPSFWATTLFLPLLIGIISFISGYSSQDTVKKIEEMGDQFKEYIVIDEAHILPTENLIEPFVLSEDKEEAMEKVKDSTDIALFYFPSDFIENTTYEIYYPPVESLIASANLQGVGSALIKQSALSLVENPNAQFLLAVSPSAKALEYNPESGFQEEKIESYIMPIASLVLFFLSVFISSTFMLQSVSMEKENRMIETILSIVDKKSLMFGKFIGLTGVVLFQLLLWIALGLGIYWGVMNVVDFDFPIDLSQLDYSVVPLNLFLIFTGFMFFSAVMMGVGAVGTGANDSKNLSSIFILLSVFPLYLMQIFITDPGSLLAQILSYFPFTSYMVLLMRNSLDALPTSELILGIVLSIAYVVIAMFIAIKMFELGCLMFNRRPTMKEALQALRQK